MKTIIALLISVCLAHAARAGRSSASYSITTDTIDTGGAKIQSANYSIRGDAVGEFGNGNQPVVTSTNYTGKLAYTGQLSDMLDPITSFSHMTQGAGTFDIDLPLVGTEGIECRNSVSNSFTIVFTFANSLGSVASVTATTVGGPAPSVSSQYDDTNSHRYLVTLSGVSNVQHTTVSLNTVNDSDGNSRATVQTKVGFLIGDTTGDGTVNSADIAQTKSKSGQTVDITNFRNDASGDGTLNSADVGLVKK